MEKSKNVLGFLNKNKKAVFILVCCVVLLVFAVVQTVGGNPSSTDKDPSDIQTNGQVNNQENNEQAGTGDNSDNNSVLPVGVEAVADIDEYFAGLRVASGEMDAETQQICNAIRTSILTRGYEDAFVCITSDNSLEITVLCSELTESEVNVIANTALDIYDTTPDNMVVKGICGV